MIKFSHLLSQGINPSCRLSVLLLLLLPFFVWDPTEPTELWFMLSWLGIINYETWINWLVKEGTDCLCRCCRSQGEMRRGQRVQIGGPEMLKGVTCFDKSKDKRTHQPFIHSAQPYRKVDIYWWNFVFMRHPHTMCSTKNKHDTGDSTSLEAGWCVRLLLNGLGRLSRPTTTPRTTNVTLTKRLAVGCVIAHLVKRGGVPVYPLTGHL